MGVNHSFHPPSGPLHYTLHNASKRQSLFTPMQLCSHYLVLLLWYVGVHLDSRNRVAAGAGVCELVALLSPSRIVLCCVIGLVVIPSSR
jgi:hypothetical protein